MLRPDRILTRIRNLVPLSVPDRGTLLRLVRRAAVPVFVGGNSVSAIRTWEYFSGFMPQWRSVAPIDDPFNPTGYVMHDWGKFLVGSDPFNRSWWVWSFDRMREDPDVHRNLSPPFRRITSAYSDPEGWSGAEAEGRGRALNEVCDSLYHHRTYEMVGALHRDLWSFCSVGGGEPITLGSAAKRARIPNSHPFRAELPGYVDATAPSNAWFWEIRQYEFLYGALRHLDLDFFNRTDRRVSVREKCHALYSLSSSSQEFKTAVNHLAILDKYNVSRFCGLATLPVGLERTEESFRYEELLFGIKNWRAP